MYAGVVYLNEEVWYMRLNKTFRLLSFLAVIVISMLLITGCAPNIDTLINEQDVEGLIEALGYKSDSKVRSSAADALGGIEDKRVVEPLIKALKDESSKVRLSALDALVEISEPAVESLIEALGVDNYNLVREGAAKALGRIGDTRAVEPLVEVLKIKYTSIFSQNRAAEALVEIGEPAVIPLLEALKDEEDSPVEKFAENIFVEIGEPAVEPLVEALKDDEDSIVRSSAAKALGEIGDKRAVEPLIEALDDEEYIVRK